MERKHITPIEISPESAVALFGEEGPLCVEVPGIYKIVNLALGKGCNRKACSY